jgi:hypothetical protein
MTDTDIYGIVRDINKRYRYYGMTPRLRRVLVREQIKMVFRDIEERERAYEIAEAIR